MAVTQLQQNLARLSALLVEEEKSLSAPSLPTRQPLPTHVRRSPSRLHTHPHFNPGIPSFLDVNPFFEGLRRPFSAPFSALNELFPLSLQSDDELVQALHESFNSHELQHRPRPSSNDQPHLKEALLKEGQVEANEELSCDICLSTLRGNTSYVYTTCCSTVTSIKRMHLKCAVHCMRRSEQCPFCKNAKIAFQ